jgi:hypothetical protein
LHIVNQKERNKEYRTKALQPLYIKRGEAMGTGGGREADKLHSMEKPIPSTLVGYRDRHWPENLRKI